jgi:hypothetical protein
LIIVDGTGKVFRNSQWEDCFWLLKSAHNASKKRSAVLDAVETGESDSIIAPLGFGLERKYTKSALKLLAFCCREEIFSVKGLWRNV